MTISERMAAELASEAAMTRRLLERIPDDKLDWKPAGDLQTIGWNARHLVEIVDWAPGILSQNEFDISPPGGQAYERPATTSTKDVLQAFDASVAESISAFQGVPDQVMDESWALKAGGQVLFTMKKEACLRKWVFSHTAHHRGILTVYLRLAGVQFRSVYEE